MADTVESLRERIAALEGRAEALERSQKAAEEHAGRLEDLVRGVPGILWEATGLPGEPDQQNTFISQQVEHILGYSVDEALGTPGFWMAIMHPEDRERMTRESATITAGLRLGTSESRVLTKDGRQVWLESFPSIMKDKTGALLGVRGVALDITRRKRMERTLQEQAATLMELSTPIIPISDQVLAMPLVGAVDAQRAELVLETMLDGIGKSRARVAILDITGVKTVDHVVAAALVRVTQAVQLLGAELVITGIRPEVAQTLVTLSVDLGRIVTTGTLEAGIAYARRKVTSDPAPRSPAGQAPRRAREP